MIESNYMKYRGKCVEMTEELVKNNPDLRIVKGFYYEPLWDREEEHQWCVDEEDNIHDPTRLQYPSAGVREFYREFKGMFYCSECGEEHPAEAMIHESNYHLCSGECYCRFVGI